MFSRIFSRTVSTGLQKPLAVKIPVVECRLSTKDFSNGYSNGRRPLSSLNNYHHWPSTRVKPSVE